MRTFDLTGLLGWRAWYTRDRVFDSVHGKLWQNLPVKGLLVVALHYETGATIVSGADWYQMWGDEMRWVSSGEWGTTQPKIDTGCMECVKEGAGVEDDEFRRVYVEAHVSTWP